MVDRYKCCAQKEEEKAMLCLERDYPNSDLFYNLHMAMTEDIQREVLGHADRMSRLMGIWGKSLGLEDEQIKELQLATKYHDIGKLAIHRDILFKTSKLSEEDWKAIKDHPNIGYYIASNTYALKHIAQNILYHHERWDGKGYPSQLKREEIPMGARMIAVIDAYDAMVSDRAYRKGLFHEEALAEIGRGEGTQFDPCLGESFRAIFIKQKDNYILRGR